MSSDSEYYVDLVCGAGSPEEREAVLDAFRQGLPDEVELQPSSKKKHGGPDPWTIASIVATSANTLLMALQEWRRQHNENREGIGKAPDGRTLFSEPLDEETIEDAGGEWIGPLDEDVNLVALYPDEVSNLEHPEEEGEE